MDFVNDNPHAIRVNRPRQGLTDDLVRVLPGRVIAADGEFADRLAATPGVRRATNEDRARDEQLLASAAGQPTAEPGHSRTGIDAALGATVDLRRALVAAPLQRVIGDDAAPAGPPSGEITTKIGAQDSPLGQRSYGENEAHQAGPVEGAGLPDPDLPRAATPTQPEVHNAQVEAAERVDAVARGIVLPAGATAAVEAPYEKYDADKLLDEADRRGLAIEGTGKNGNVVKADIVSALEADDAEKNSEPAQTEEVTA